MRDAIDRRDMTIAARDAAWNTPSIQKSRERSETYGLSEAMQPDYDVLSSGELTLRIEQSRVLCAHATPVMESLHEQIVNTQSMIVLTDAQGLILHSIGDDDFLRRAEKVALRPGANWAESRQGTNAIGTAIEERSPTVVHGDEHYLVANRFLTCSSVPIMDPYGDLIGVLDVTGDHRSYHQHTMALAKMSVQMIENHLFMTTFRDTLRIAFHSRPEFLGTLMEGIAAFTCDGRFLSANRSAQFQLGLPLNGLRAHTLSSLFGLGSAQLIDRARSSAGQHIALATHAGTTVCAHVELRRTAMTARVPEHVSERASGSRPDDSRAGRSPAAQTAGARTAEARAIATAAPMSRLQYLDTGDPQIGGVITKIRKVLGKGIPILITGETGTGKELLAQAIHNDSPRHAGPFVAVNCASIPESLIESELFGYEEGAFTGARRKGAPGKLLQADGGTLFLDEIGDMPYPLQVRLLRVLQERVVNPLGSGRSIPVDIAVVCATHRDLREMIVANRFREDLYYRLNGLVVRLPPLRERTDLETVIQKLLQFESAERRRMGQAGGYGESDDSDVAPLRVAPDVMALFRRCAFPGNFRQLGNLLRTAAAMVDDDGEIRREHLPDDFFEDLQTQDLAVAGSATALATASATEFPAELPANCVRLQDIEAQTIAATVARFGGNVSAAARALGVSRNTIYRKLPGTAATDGPDGPDGADASNGTNSTDHTDHTNGTDGD